MKPPTLLGALLVFSLAVGLAFYSAAEIGGGDIVYRPEGPDPVVFSHARHVEVSALTCTRCHAEIFEMSRENFAGPRRRPEPLMELMAAGRFCGHCHNNSRAFTVEENCALCHVRTETQSAED